MKTITYDETKHKLVPIEPTYEMIDAGMREYDAVSPLKTLLDGYKAIIAASPETPK